MTLRKDSIVRSAGPIQGPLPGYGTAVLEKTRTRFRPRWRVILHNDDVTSMQYVVIFLQDVFGKNAEDAFKLMTQVHEEGAGTAYLGTKEACELKYEQSQEHKKTYGQVLKISIEPLDE